MHVLFRARGGKNIFRLLLLWQTLELHLIYLEKVITSINSRASHCSLSIYYMPHMMYNIRDFFGDDGGGSVLAFVILNVRSFHNISSRPHMHNTMYTQQSGAMLVKLLQNEELNYKTYM